MNGTPTNRQRIYELLGDNNGVVTISMAAASGVPAVELRKLAQRGALQRVGRGVYRIPFAPMNNFSTASEMTAIVSENSYVVGDSVLAMLEIGVSNPRFWSIATNLRVRSALPENVRLVDAQDDDQVDLIQGVRCQRVSQVLERRIGAVRSNRLVEEINEAYRLQLIDFEEFKALLDAEKTFDN